MRSGIHGRESVPLQTGQRIARIIKHPKADKHAGGVALDNKYILTVDPENDMGECRYYRDAVPKIERHGAPWDWAVATNRRWKRRAATSGAACALSSLVRLTLYK
jgi:hypothetical protein